VTVLERPTTGSPAPACRVCGARAGHVTTVHGRFLDQDYRLARCASCGFAFVANPTLAFTELYDDRYYNGDGADPLVDYYFELEHPERTIRTYEWSGLATVASHLIGSLSGVRWVDFGCGNGGLVRYLREKRGVDAIGLEDGSIATRAQELRIPVQATDRLADHQGTADVVTAIEVLEHTYDPVGELKTMRKLLKPGGLLLLTTGNLRPYAERLGSWRYVVPEIHISFFEPRTLAYAMDQAGFRPERRALGPGFDQILKSKVLKNLRVKRRSLLTDLIPPRLVGPIADRVAHLSEHPVGWAI
jgi:SAM-dependent methyltransferase